MRRPVSTLGTQDDRLARWWARQGDDMDRIVRAVFLGVGVIAAPLWLALVWVIYNSVA